MEIRTELIQTIFNKFKEDLVESASLIPDNQNTIYYIEKIRDLMLGIYHTRPPSDLGEAIYFDEDEFIRQFLYAHFHEKMEAFNKTGLRYYFCKESHHQEQLFKKLNIKEPLLNWKEYEDLSQRQFNLLNKCLDTLHLKPAENKTKAPQITDPDGMNLEEQNGTENLNLKEYTRNRQAIAYHYIMACLGYTKGKANHADLARFSNVLFALSKDKIENSNIYKNIKNAPLHLSKTKKQTLKDLNFVREYFVKIDCQPALKLIDEDIAYVERNVKPD